MGRYSHAIVVVSFLALMFTACSGGAHYGSSKGYYKVGNPYKIKGKWYHPKVDNNYDKKGMASWYGPKFHGKRTANGEIFNQRTLTAAHQTLPLPSMVRVTNLQNGRTTIVKVNDRGPFSNNRIIDLSRHAAEVLGFKEQGLTQVRVQYLKEETNRLHASLGFNKATTNFAKASTKAIKDKLPTKIATKIEPVASAISDNLEMPPYKIASRQLHVPDRGYVSRSRTAYDIPDYQPQSYNLNTSNAQPVYEQAAYSPKPIASIPATPAATPAYNATPGELLFIQAGAFSMRENAEVVLRKLLPFGSVNIMPTNQHGKTMYRVRIGPFASLNDAEQKLPHIQQTADVSAVIVSNKIKFVEE